jgi:hypothetical protein
MVWLQQVESLVHSEMILVIKYINADIASDAASENLSSQ